MKEEEIKEEDDEIESQVNPWGETVKSEVKVQREKPKEEDDFPELKEDSPRP